MPKRNFVTTYTKCFNESTGKVGITLDSMWFEPYNSSSSADVTAAETKLQFTVGLLNIQTFIGLRLETLISVDIIIELYVENRLLSYRKCMKQLYIRLFAAGA